eukprot:14102-Chlamydomonas_euryale.AAC.1
MDRLSRFDHEVHLSVRDVTLETCPPAHITRATLDPFRSPPTSPPTSPVPRLTPVPHLIREDHRPHHPCHT